MKKPGRKNKTPRLIGITGGFGSGKTTVSGFFRGRGTKLIDADLIVYRLLEPGTEVYRKLISVFGSKIVSPDRKIDRKALARIVFAKPPMLNRLNRIIHPQVIRIIKKEAGGSGAKKIVVDAPLLFEAGLERMMDKVIVVYADTKNQVRRLRRHSSLSVQEIQARIRAQMPLKKKLRMADFVIDNNGTPGQTRKQAAIIRRLLWKS